MLARVGSGLITTLWTGAAIGLAAGSAALVAVAALGGVLTPVGGGLGLTIAVALGGLGELARARFFPAELFERDGSLEEALASPELLPAASTNRSAQRGFLGTRDDRLERLIQALASADPELGPQAAAALARRGADAAVTVLEHCLVRIGQESSQLGRVAEHLAAGANGQSKAVGRTTTTVERLSARIDRISQNAEAATQASELTSSEARRGLEQVHEVIGGMEQLVTSAEANGRKVRRLGDRSTEISEFVEMISGISSRTDMLALNATIESVRAGEHGRGFAVVAEEIRKLSDRTAQATKEIEGLVEAIQADTHECIRALGEEQTRIRRQAEQAQLAGEALQRIGDVAAQSVRQVEGISQSATDQVRSTGELVASMQQISETARRSQESADQARVLVDSLDRRCAPLNQLGPGRESNPNRGARATTRRRRAAEPSARRRATSERTEAGARSNAETAYDPAAEPRS